MVLGTRLDSSIRLHVRILHPHKTDTDITGEPTEKDVVDSVNRFHSRVLTPTRSCSRLSN
jgi:hypothetical protein